MVLRRLSLSAAAVTVGAVAAVMTTVGALAAMLDATMAVGSSGVYSHSTVPMVSLHRFAQRGFVDLAAVDEAVIRGAKVAEDVVAVHGDELGVVSGHGAVIDLDRVIRAPTDGDAATGEGEGRISLFGMFDEEFGHGLLGSGRGEARCE